MTVRSFCSRGGMRMYTFILTIIDAVDRHNLHWFMIFFLFVLVRWAIVFFTAGKYRPYDCPNKRMFTSVIIPIVDEAPELFRKVLTQIAQQLPDEVIVVINGPENPALAAVCAELEEEWKGRLSLRHFYTPVPGKRNAIRIGVENAAEESEIAVLVDSDTIWTENTLKELLKPFSADEKIGGVTTRQRIFQPERNLLTMFANLLEEIRAEGSMKAMSVTGKVGCLPGRTIAFRMEILRGCMREFMTERFMDIHIEFSDDRSLTNFALKQGYKTVMQDTALVLTDAPVTWRKFVRQQLRWASGSQYNNLRMTPWMLRSAPLMAFIYWTDMIMPLMLISVYVNMLLCAVLERAGVQTGRILYAGPWWVLILLTVTGCIISFGSRQIRVFSRQPAYYLLLIPVFIFILSSVMIFIRVAGLMRCADEQKWGTRALTEAGHEKG